MDVPEDIYISLLMPCHATYLLFRGQGQLLQKQHYMDIPLQASLCPYIFLEMEMIDGSIQAFLISSVPPAYPWES